MTSSEIQLSRWVSKTVIPESYKPVYTLLIDKQWCGQSTTLTDAEKRANRVLCAKGSISTVILHFEQDAPPGYPYSPTGWTRDVVQIPVYLAEDTVVSFNYLSVELIIDLLLSRGLVYAGVWVVDGDMWL